MNLRISYNWLKEYVKTGKSAREFARELSLCGPTVDRVFPVEADFKKVVVGEILTIKNHPQADKLRLCEVSVGKKEALKIVCGAPNIAVGQKVPVVLVGGRVRDTVIKSAKIRGEESHGMLCSQEELGIGQDHSGIFILPSYVEVGLPLEKVIPIKDDILEIEITANRPDAMCAIGIAREAAAIFGDKLLYREPKPNLKIGQEKKISVSVKEPKLCPRYQAAVINGVKVETSPLWLQQRLLASGIRPINNLVDITNYVMLEFGQPLHVFDYEKLNSHRIVVRLAKAGERILALDGKNYELSEDDLVIADDSAPVAVAGVMGGELSAASISTKTIVLEAANFSPQSIRKTARVLNLHSESSDLFEKGLSPQNTLAALLRAVELVLELAGGRLAASIADEKYFDEKQKSVNLSPERVAAVLGAEIKPSNIKSILSSLGFEIKDHKGKRKDDQMKVVVPWWRRADIEGEHDLIEEIARLYGYYRLPADLMAGKLPADLSENVIFSKEASAKNFMVAAGFCENYNYSFVSEKLIKDCGLDISKHIKLANPLSADFEYLRTELLPGLIQSAADNEGNSKKIKIFELSKVYESRGQNLPSENIRLAALYSAQSAEADFLAIKGVLAALARKFGIENWRLEDADHYCLAKKSAAQILIDSQVVGQIGIVSRDVAQLVGLKRPVAAMEIDFEKFVSAGRDNPVYRPLPKFPSIELDLSMEIAREVGYGAVVQAINGIDPLIESVGLLSVYSGDKLPAGQKALAVRLVYRAGDRTLTLAEAQTAHKKVVAKMEKEYNIKVR